MAQPDEGSNVEHRTLNFEMSAQRADPVDVERFCVNPQSDFECFIKSITTHPELSNEVVTLGREMKWIP